MGFVIIGRFGVAIGRITVSGESCAVALVPATAEVKTTSRPLSSNPEISYKNEHILDIQLTF